jgi:hypothetical protein
MKKKVQPVTKRRTIDRLRRPFPAQPVRTFQHHHVMTGRGCVKGRGKTGNARTNHRDLCHEVR